RAARFVETAYRRGYRFVAAAAPCAQTEHSVALPIVRPTAETPARDRELTELVRDFVEAVSRLVERANREPRRAGRARQRAVASPKRPPRERRVASRCDNRATRRT